MGELRLEGGDFRVESGMAAGAIGDDEDGVWVVGHVEGRGGRGAEGGEFGDD